MSEVSESVLRFPALEFFNYPLADFSVEGSFVSRRSDVEGQVIPQGVGPPYSPPDFSRKRCGT